MQLWETTDYKTVFCINKLNMLLDNQIIRMRSTQPLVQLLEFRIHVNDATWDQIRITILPFLPFFLLLLINYNLKYACAHS